MKLRKTELEAWIEGTRMLEARLVPINPACFLQCYAASPDEVQRYLKLLQKKQAATLLDRSDSLLIFDVLTGSGEW